MKALRTAINDFFTRNDIAWEGFMGILVIVWLALGSQPRNEVLTLVMDSITLIFALEFSIRFLATYEHVEYFKSHWIDAVTLLPALRGFRLLRLLRLLRLVRATRGLANQISVLEYIAGDLTIRSLFVIWFTVTLLASLLFYFAEASGNPAVDGPTDALWWAIVTATTVGYGDVYPTTAAGRAAGVVMMLVGIATFSALAGLIGSALQRRRAELKAGLTADDISDAEEAGTTTDDPAFRLRRLVRLRDEGLITSEEYETQRAAVVADL
jgi:voltage-gated potassium channel